MKGVVAAVVERHQHPEFVAARTRQHVAGPERALDPARDRDQQFVAGHPAQTRVDPAEPVEIDDQHRMRRAPGIAARDKLLDHFAECGAIGQARQRVGLHLAAQALFGAAFGSLIDQHHQTAVRAQ